MMGPDLNATHFHGAQAYTKLITHALTHGRSAHDILSLLSSLSEERRHDELVQGMVQRTESGLRGPERPHSWWFMVALQMVALINLGMLDMESTVRLLSQRRPLDGCVYVCGTGACFQ